MRTVVACALVLAGCGGDAFTVGDPSATDPPMATTAATVDPPLPAMTADPPPTSAEAGAPADHPDAGSDAAPATPARDAGSARPEAGEPLDAADAAPVQCWPGTTNDGGLVYQCGGKIVDVVRSCYPNPDGDPTCGLGGTIGNLPAPWVWCGNPTTLPCVTSGGSQCCQIKEAL